MKNKNFRSYQFDEKSKINPILKVLPSLLFPILAVFLLIFELIYISTGQWAGDFWEHSAVIKELSKNLIHPSNPIINSNIPHPFYSPYSLIVAIFSRITNLNVIESLEYFAVFNLVFFLFSFHKFCVVLFKENHKFVSAISLFFILFFCGKDPFSWSGFYHIQVLHYVLPYPSTFSMALSFLILSIIAKKQTGKFSFKKYILIIPLSSIVFLTHPTTAIFLYIGIITLAFTFNSYSIKHCIIQSSLIIVPSLLLTYLWPYFNIVDLIMEQNVHFNNECRKLYSDIFQKNWPVLLILPGFFIIKKNTTSFFLISSIILLITAYLSGYLMGIYGLSRLISTILIFAHFLTAYTIILSIKKNKLYGTIYASLVFLFFIYSIKINSSGLLYSFKMDNVGIEEYDKYNFLRSYVKSNDLILSDLNTNRFIPTFSGKVVATNLPLHWVSDSEERRKDMELFFDKESSDSLRLSIINNYKPNFILLNFSKITLSPLSVQWIENRGDIIYKLDQMELIAIRYY